MPSKDNIVLIGEKKARDEEYEAAETKAKQLPKPMGYKILCMVPKADEKFESGIIKADQTRHVEEHATLVLFVVELGDMAYKDKSRFPNGPWCQKGDFVITRAYSGTRVKIHDTEFRLINDDSVEAIVEDPRGISRA